MRLHFRNITLNLPKLASGILLVLFIAALALSGYFYTNNLELSKKNSSLKDKENQLSTVTTELNQLKNQDQYKRNEAL